MSEALAIDVRGLSKRFGAREVVRGLSLQVRRGEIFGFLGPNGSGKTTSIRMMCGLLTPDAGSGRCLGFELRETERIRREVGYMTQRFSFWEDLSVRENLDFFARLYEVPQRRDAVNRMLADSGLAARADQLAGTLSGGWKQRLALAACMLHEPQLLLLDEPTAGVDPNARRVFWDELHRLAARGIAVLVSTHYMDEAERCHKLAYIANGRLLVQGTAEQIVAAEGLFTRVVRGESLADIVALLRAEAGVAQTVLFGASLHVSGPDAAALDAAIARVGRERALHSATIATGLEDVFIHLMQRAAADTP